MKLSTKAKYGLKACFVLALHYGDGIVSLSVLAKEAGVSPAYLEQLFIKLRREGILDSVRGAAGGYCLTGPPGEITVGYVMRTLEGGLDISDCVSKSCAGASTCPTRAIWQRLTDGVNRIADSITLQDMVDDYRASAGEAREHDEPESAGEKEE